MAQVVIELDNSVLKQIQNKEIVDDFRIKNIVYDAIRKGQTLHTHGVLKDVDKLQTDIEYDDDGYGSWQKDSGYTVSQVRNLPTIIDAYKELNELEKIIQNDNSLQEFYLNEIERQEELSDNSINKNRDFLIDYIKYLFEQKGSLIRDDRNFRLYLEEIYKANEYDCEGVINHNKVLYTDIIDGYFQNDTTYAVDLLYGNGILDFDFTKAYALLNKVNRERFGIGLIDEKMEIGVNVNEPYFKVHSEETGWLDIPLTEDEEDIIRDFLEDIIEKMNKEAEKEIERD